MMKFAAFGLVLLNAIGLLPGQEDSYYSYPLQSQIEHAFKTGDFRGFVRVCDKKITVNMTRPLEINGYYVIEQFRELITRRYQEYNVVQIKWTSRMIDEKFTTESLMLKLKHKKNRRVISYRLIFFLKKDNKKWKIYYLRGLRE